MRSDPEVLANMRATTEAFLGAFDGTWNLEAALAPGAPECVDVHLPSSLAIPDKNNDEWATLFKSTVGLIKHAKVSPLVAL